MVAAVAARRSRSRADRVCSSSSSPHAAATRPTTASSASVRRHDRRLGIERGSPLWTSCSPIADVRAQDAHRPRTIEHVRRMFASPGSWDQGRPLGRDGDAYDPDAPTALMFRAEWDWRGGDERGHQIRAAGPGCRRVVRLRVPGPDRDLPWHRRVELLARRDGDRRCLHAVGAAQQAGWPFLVAASPASPGRRSLARSPTG